MFLYFQLDLKIILLGHAINSIVGDLLIICIHYFIPGATYFCCSLYTD